MNTTILELKRSMEIESEQLSLLNETLDWEALSRVAELLAACEGRIIMTGCGTSAMAARKIAHSLNCIERPAFFLTPSDAVHGGLGALQKGDVLILISKGGGTEELVRLLRACKAKGAASVAVTENADSALGRGCDMLLKVRVEREPCRWGMLATASTLAVIAVFDAICIALMQLTGYTKEQFALIHPGGAVGERLTKKEAER